MKCMRMNLKDETQIKEESGINEIPPDDGHQMSQTEIDNLIALLLNK